MSHIDRRSMLKVMAATAAGAAGAALGGSAIETVLADTPNPGGGRGLLGSQSGASVKGPLVVPTTANTLYASYQGSDFDAGGSTYVWSVSGGTKAQGNGGFYVRRLNLPQGSVLTECKFFFKNPTTSPGLFVLEGSLDGIALNIIASAPAPAVSAAVQQVDLVVIPTTIDNAQLWYELDFESGGATDTVIYGARVGWLHAPGLTSFPNPRRVVSSAMVSGTTYGPFDATTTVSASPSGVPAGAQAAFCAVQSYTPGVLTLFPDGATDPMIANYSGTGTQGAGLNVIYMLVPLSAAGKFKIHSYITGNVFVDVWGYLFPPG